MSTSVTWAAKRGDFTKKDFTSFCLTFPANTYRSLKMGLLAGTANLAGSEFLEALVDCATLAEVETTGTEATATGAARTVDA